MVWHSRVNLGFFAVLPDMFEETVVIDCRGHLMGRLAATIAKELLNGQHIVCVRTEEINISGSRTCWDFFFD